MSRDDTKLAFSSAFRYQRVFLRGSDTVADSDVVVDHNLGYRPFVRVFALYPNGKYGNVANFGETPQSTEFLVLVTVSTTQLTIDVFDDTLAGRSLTVYYKIYADPLS